MKAYHLLHRAGLAASFAHTHQGQVFLDDVRLIFLSCWPLIILLLIMRRKAEIALVHSEYLGKQERGIAAHVLTPCHVADVMSGLESAV
jgi:hypothetical protein